MSYGDYTQRLNAVYEGYITKGKGNFDPTKLSSDEKSLFTKYANEKYKNQPIQLEHSQVKVLEGLENKYGIPKTNQLFADCMVPQATSAPKTPLLRYDPPGILMNEARDHQDEFGNKYTLESFLALDQTVRYEKQGDGWMKYNANNPNDQGTFVKDSVVRDETPEVGFYRLTQQAKPTETAAPKPTSPPPPAKVRRDDLNGKQSKDVLSFIDKNGNRYELVSFNDSANPTHNYKKVGDQWQFSNNKSSGNMQAGFVLKVNVQNALYQLIEPSTQQNTTSAPLPPPISAPNTQRPKSPTLPPLLTPAKAQTQGPAATARTTPTPQTITRTVTDQEKSDEMRSIDFMGHTFEGQEYDLKSFTVTKNGQLFTYSKQGDKWLENGVNINNNYKVFNQKPETLNYVKSTRTTPIVRRELLPQFNNPEGISSNATARPPTIASRPAPKPISPFGMQNRASKGSELQDGEKTEGSRCWLHSSLQAFIRTPAFRAAILNDDTSAPRTGESQAAYQFRTALKALVLSDKQPSSQELTHLENCATYLLTNSAQEARKEYRQQKDSKEMFLALTTMYAPGTTVKYVKPSGEQLTVPAFTPIQLSSLKPEAIIDRVTIASQGGQSSYKGQYKEAPENITFALNKPATPNDSDLTACKELNVPSKCFENGKPATYQLSSFVMHTGTSAAAGHYVTFVKNDHDNQWTMYNDNTMVQMSEETALKCGRSGDNGGVGIGSPTTLVKKYNTPFVIFKVTSSQ